MKEASNLAHGVDYAFYFIIGIDLIFLIGLTAAMLFFVFKYSRKKHPKAEQIKENMWLEVIWTGIPLILVLAMFYVGYYEYKPLRVVPKDAIKITAIGKMWSWTFIYPNGKESDKLYVPYNKSVVLNLESKDVIHSLSIPAFRIKEDVVPGKTNFLWFIPTIKDTFDVFCTAYCGVRHSSMLSQVIVVDNDKYEAWVSQVEKKSEVAELPGLKVLQNNACLGCHSLEAMTLVGPSFKDLFGSKRTVLTNGAERSITVDEEYITNSVLDPGKDVAKGFTNGIMQSYKTVLKDQDIKDIVAYFKANVKK